MTAGMGLADLGEVHLSAVRQKAALDLHGEQTALAPDPPATKSGTEAGDGPAAAAAVPPATVQSAEPGAPPAVGGSVAAARSLHRAAVEVRHHVENTVLRDADLSWTGYAVLALTCEERSIETRAVAAAIGISRGTLTGVVRTLESRSLLQRVPHCRDGRLVLLEPTTTGRRLVRRLSPRVTHAEDNAISCLDGGERDTLAGLLGRLIASLSAD